MEVKLLLLKAISFLYYRSHGTVGKTTSNDILMEKVLSNITLPDDDLDSGISDRNPLLKLRSLLLWMSRNDPSHVYELNDFLTRVRLACGDNDRLYELFMQNILQTTPEAADDRVSTLVSDLTQHIATEELVGILRTSSRSIAFNRDKIDNLVDWRADLISKIEALPLEGKRRLNTLAKSIDIDDLDSVAAIYESAQAHIDPKMIMKFPYMGLNDMTGPQQGARRGDWIVHCALPGQNKTGVLIETFCGWALLNDPHLIDPKKIPTLVYTTIEDKVEVVFQKFYTILKQVELKKPVKVVGVPFREMASYVKETFTKRGWKVIINEFPQGGHNDEYLQIFRDLEDTGHEVVAAALDYCNLLGKKGIPAVVAGDEIKYLHRHIRGYTMPRGIIHMSPHQLGPKAKEAFRMDPLDYIRRLPNQGSFEGCSSLDTEPDLMFYVAKTQHNKGQCWGQFMFDKHRRIGSLPDHLKYFAMKFLPFPMMGFEWDVLTGKSGAYDKVGAMKPRPQANWETLAEINPDNQSVDDDDYGF